MEHGEVVVEVEVRPTEDPQKIETVIRTFFKPDIIDWEEIGNSKILIAKSRSLKSLERFHRLLRIQRILDAARNVFKRMSRNGVLTFYLHKQALAVGKISFVSGDQESPLGAVKVTIRYSDIHEVIDWLSPPTQRGRPIWEKGVPKE